MNRLQRLLHRHTIGELDKLAYIEGIHAQHSMLFDYISFMENSDVADIRIQPSGIAVTSRSQQVAMYLDPDDQHLVPYTLLNFGSYETVETEFLKTVAQPGWSVLDIGANCGWYSLVLARKSPEITVHAFEPIPSTCLLLQRNIKLNDLKCNCAIYLVICSIFSMKNHIWDIRHWWLKPIMTTKQAKQRLCFFRTV